MVCFKLTGVCRQEHTGDPIDFTDANPDNGHSFSFCMTTPPMTASQRADGLSPLFLACGKQWLWPIFVALAGLVLLCGCQTPKDLFTASGSGWQVRQGQALWRPKKDLPEFGGDLVLATDAAGRCLIQFDKTPMEIVSTQTTSNHWLIRFPQQQRAYSGHQPAPTYFGWLYLPTALAGRPLPKPFTFERLPDGGWRLTNSHTGESLRGFLSP